MAAPRSGVPEVSRSEIVGDWLGWLASSLSGWAVVVVVLEGLLLEEGKSHLSGTKSFKSFSAAGSRRERVLCGQYRGFR